MARLCLCVFVCLLCLCVLFVNYRVFAWVVVMCLRGLCVVCCAMLCVNQNCLCVVCDGLRDVAWRVFVWFVCLCVMCLRDLREVYDVLLYGLSLVFLFVCVLLLICLRDVKNDVLCSCVWFVFVLCCI